MSSLSNLAHKKKDLNYSTNLSYPVHPIPTISFPIPKPKVKIQLNLIQHKITRQSSERDQV